MNKKTLLIVVVSLLVLANIGVFVFLFIDSKKEHAQTAIISQQEREQMEKERKEREEQARAEKEIEDIKKGLMKMLTGIVETIDKDNKNLVIDIDPLGEHSRYSILIAANAEYFFLENKPIGAQIEPGSSEEEFMERSYEAVFTDANFESIAVGQNIEVQFAERVDIDSGVKLIAQKVLIFKQ